MNGLKLSPRETEVVRLLVSGLTSSEIALRFGRSRRTISAQKIAAAAKLGMHGLSNARFLAAGRKYLKSLKPSDPLEKASCDPESLAGSGDSAVAR